MNNMNQETIREIHDLSVFLFNMNAEALKKYK